MTTKTTAKAKKVMRKACAKNAKCTKCTGKCSGKSAGKCEEITMKNFCILWGCILALVLVFVAAFSILIPLAKEQDASADTTTSSSDTVEQTEEKVEEAEKVLEQN